MEVVRNVYLYNNRNRVLVLSCQPKVTMTSYSVFEVIRDLKSINHPRIDPILRIGPIHK